MRCWLPFRDCDVANGDGVRVTLFVTGCRIHCPGCFNSECWSFESGEPFTEEIHNKLIEALKPSWISGFTCLGGEPMEPENQTVLVHLFKDIKRAYPDKTIWCYTGYVWDRDLVYGGKKYIPKVTNELLSYVDVLVDGPFVEALKDPSLKFRGSSNQRIIHFNWNTTHDVVIEGDNQNG